MDLEQLKKEVRELKAIAATDLDTITDPRIRYNAQGAKNSAQQRLDSLVPKLIDSLLSNSRTLILVDDLPKKLEGLGEAEGSISVDFMSLEKELVDKIFADKSNKTYAFNSYTQDKINILLHELFVKKVNARDMTAMMLKGDTFETVSTREAAIQKMHKWITAAYGDELKTILMRYEVFESAKKQADLDSLTIIVSNVPTDSVNTLLSITRQSVILSATGEEPNSIKVTEDMTDEDLLGKLKKAFGNKRRK